MPEVGLPCLAPQRGSEAVCAMCLADLTDVISALPDDYDRLSAVIARRGGTDGEFVTADKPGSKPPIDIHIDALRTHLVYSASLWERIIRDHCGLSPSRAGAVRERQSLVRSVSILAPRIDVLIALSPVEAYFDGVEAGLVRRDGLAGARRLHRLHEAISRTVGLASVTIRLPGACPTCGAERLRRDVGADTVYCGSCDGRWTYDDYTRHVRLMIG